MKYQYVQSKLVEAIEWMAWHPGDVRARLQDVYMVLIAINDEEWPPELLSQWKHLERRLTARGPVTIANSDRVITGAAKNTLRRMRNSTASKLAQMLIGLAHSVREANYDAQQIAQPDAPASGSSPV
jgi:hypothetical protein